MRSPSKDTLAYQRPALLNEATELSRSLKKLPLPDIQTAMKVSQSLAKKTHDLVHSFTIEEALQRPAIDAFLGDIYSGLQVDTFEQSDRKYANQHLYILSGLYGILRALDSIYPYRLEMGYRLPDEKYTNLYQFWGEALARELPTAADIVNVSSVEYTKAVLPYTKQRVITPTFKTFNPTTRQATFVTVHAKIARGAFAHWMIKHRINSIDLVQGFNELGYTYDAPASTLESPVFVCQTFGGLGLSVRLR